MDCRIHTKFWNWSRRFIVRGVTLAAIVLVVTLAALKFGLSITASILLVVLGVIAAAIPTIYTYRLYRAECPDCGEKMATTKQPGLNRYVARCKQCERLWVMGDISHG